MRLLNQADLIGKRVLIRLTTNVPLDAGVITDTTRLDASLPTIKHCIQHAKQVILCGHLGRPKTQDSRLSLRPIAQYLEKKLNQPVPLIQDFSVDNQKIVLLENIRFFECETINDQALALKLASLADVCVLDAFADMHRKHASTYGVAEHLPAYAGYVVQKEVTMLERVLNPQHPFVAIVGFAKITDKIQLLNNLLKKVDKLCIGGGVVYTFFKAANIEVGKSLVETDMIPHVEKILRKYGSKLQLPTDIVVADSPEDTHPQTVAYTKIPADKMGLDIGPLSAQSFANTIDKAKTVFWNGPVGMFEHPPFDKGTIRVAHKLASVHATSVVGGGDTINAIKRAGVYTEISHCSTGGGATLLFLSGDKLPGLEVLNYY